MGKDKKMRWFITFGVLVCFVTSVLLASGCAAPATAPVATEEVDRLKGEVSRLEADKSSLEAKVAALQAPAKVYKWKCQHTWGAPEGYVFDQYADIVREMTDGQIDITMYAGGELVPYDDAADAIRLGTLDMGIIEPVQWAETRWATFTHLCWVFTDLEELAAFLYSLGYEELVLEGFEEIFQIKALGCGMDDSGAMVWTEDFHSLADLKGRKASSYPPLSDMLANAGISTSFIPSGELYTSLATGVIDGLAYGHARAYYDYGFFEVAKYFMLPPHMPTGNMVYCINPELYNKLNPGFQSILRQASWVNGLYIETTLRKLDSEMLAEAIEEWGVEVRYLPNEDIEQMRKWSLEYVDEVMEESLFGKRAGDLLYNALRLFGKIE